MHHGYHEVCLCTLFAHTFCLLCTAQNHIVHNCKHTGAPEYGCNLHASCLTWHIRSQWIMYHQTLLFTWYISQTVVQQIFIWDYLLSLGFDRVQSSYFFQADFTFRSAVDYIPHNFFLTNVTNVQKWFCPLSMDTSLKPFLCDLLHC